MQKSVRAKSLSSTPIAYIISVTAGDKEIYPSASGRDGTHAEIDKKEYKKPAKIHPREIKASFLISVTSLEVFYRRQVVGLVTVAGQRPDLRNFPCRRAKSRFTILVYETNVNLSHP